LAHASHVLMLIPLYQVTSIPRPRLAGSLEMPQRLAIAPAVEEQHAVVVVRRAVARLELERPLVARRRVVAAADGAQYHAAVDPDLVIVAIELGGLVAVGERLAHAPLT